MTGLSVRPMTDAEFAAWAEDAGRGYAEAKVAAGAWPAAEALDLARRDTAGRLPQGRRTPGLLLLTAEADDGTPVCCLRIALKHPDGVPHCAWL